jgi:hypothetical protein
MNTKTTQSHPKILRRGFLSIGAFVAVAAGLSLCGKSKGTQLCEEMNHGW